MGFFTQEKLKFFIERKINKEKIVNEQRIRIKTFELAFHSVAERCFFALRSSHFTYNYEILFNQ